ncbi:hypothetical protein HOP52_17820 [Halomonas campisalis]|uniref:MrpA C-terminal/MbhD domain-containing protein n=1 Tax=Billgrantia campisalis TaxID=74661 RepID=A0ABS9PCX0_9GAMM|nr:NADH-quinone oxidoreductase subunit K [Halomonas campisalis]MCG6659612.1 hypothetical protein [Halomonas campisalis]MDR5864573.1 NADH-quinone oxidoreductase subunit K [Halomonas campisalis]
MLLLDELLLTLALVTTAALALFDRQLIRACALFVLFALTVALAWWRLGFPWLALLEVLLGAALTGAFLFHALGVMPWARAPRGRLSRWRDPVPLNWRRGFFRLLPALAAVGMLGIALASLPAINEAPGPLRLSGTVLFGLGLWAFALQRHLLRRLLAFNIIGTGIFLLLMSLAREVSPAAGQGLVITGLVVALLGTMLGALLIRRLNGLDGRRVMASMKNGGGP